MNTIINLGNDYSIVEKEINEDYEIYEYYIQKPDGSLKYIWNSQNIECPEDLTWARSICGVFMMGIETGKSIVRNEP